MIGYQTPTYDLCVVQQAMNNVGKLRMTKRARTDAVALGLDDQDIVDVIQSIGPRDFYKTMPSLKLPDAQYQDVYKVVWEELYLYIKFQYIGGYLVVSFKLV